MIGFGTSPGKTHSADVRGGGAGQALSCFVGVAASTSEEIAVLEVKA